MLTEGVSEDRVVVAMATTCFTVAVAESDTLADLKLRGVLRRLLQGAGRSCMLSFRSRSESPRVAMEHLLPSVVRTEAAKATFGYGPSGDGIFAN